MSHRLGHFAPLSGVAFVVLFAVGSVLSGSEPGVHASTAKVLCYFGTSVTRHNVSYYVSALAIATGLLFYALLCEHLRVGERSPRLARAAFGGAFRRLAVFPGDDPFPTMEASRSATSEPESSADVMEGHMSQGSHTARDRSTATADTTAGCEMEDPA